jgi:fatty acid synthase subunit alpha, fungi type
MKLWKELDDTVFKLPKEKRELWLAERKEEIIGKLNKDFAKPWFGWKKDASVATDLGDMTYEETVLRMVRLMFVSHEKRWVDDSLRNLTGDWLRRVEERFAGVNGGGVKVSFGWLGVQLALCFGFFSYRCSRDFICRQSFTPYSRTSG